MFAPTMWQGSGWRESIGRYPRASAAIVLIPSAVLIGAWLPRQSMLLAAATALVLAFAALTVARPWVAIWVYLGVLVLNPNYVGVSLGSIGDATLTRTLGLAVALVLVYQKGIRPSAWNPIDWCFGAYLLATTLPDMFKGDSAVYALKLLVWSGLDYGVPYLVLRTAASNLASARRVLRMFAFWAIIIALFAIAEVFSGTNLFTDVGPQLSASSLWSQGIFRAETLRARVSFSHPISLGMYAALLLPLMLWMIRWSRGWQRTFALVAAIAVGVTLLATLSRGPWLGALVALALAIPFQSERSRRRTAITFGAIAVGVVAVYLSGATPLTQILSDSFNPATDAYGNILYRQSLTEVILPVWSRSPWIGYPDYVADGAFSTSLSIDNHYLATLIVQGAVGLVAFLLVVAAALWTCWSATRRKGAAESDLAATMLAVLLGQLVILGTVAMIGLGPQVFWGFVGFCAGAWSGWQGAAAARPRLVLAAPQLSHSD
jgi:O-antigen ligase